MQQNSVAPGNWQDFFNDFSIRNQSRIVSIEVLSEDIGAQQAVKKMPLKGIVFDTGNKNISSLQIMLENRRADETGHLTHIIQDVLNVYPKRNLNGRDVALEIEEKLGTKTLLVFEPLRELSAGSMHATAYNKLW